MNDKKKDQKRIAEALQAKYTKPGALKAIEAEVYNTEAVMEELRRRKQKNNKNEKI